MSIEVWDYRFWKVVFGHRRGRMQILIAQPQRLKALAERQSFLFSHCTVTHPSRILPCSAEVFTVQVQISTSVALYFERFPKSNGLNGSWSFLVDFAEWVTRLSSGTFVSIDRDYKSSTNPSHWYKTPLFLLFGFVGMCIPEDLFKKNLDCGSGKISDFKLPYTSKSFLKLQMWL